MGSSKGHLWLVLLCYALAASACDYSGQKWSTSQALKAGANVNIASGARVYLDVSPGVIYGSIVIDGTLVVADADIELKSQWILVRKGGSLIVGTPECPITKKVTIILHGSRTVNNDIGTDAADGTGFGTKGVVVATGGSIQMFGQINGPTWTRLSAIARNGTKTIQVEDAINWKIGDKIVIASTDFSEVLDYKKYQGKDDYKELIGQPFPDQNEVRTITAVDGKKITLDTGLVYSHWGQGYEKAEVGLLTRRIVLKGDDSTVSDAFGGHLMIRKGPITKISGVELTQMGQQGILGRYPVHFHVMGDTNDVVFSSNSIHDTFQRALSVHESYNINISDNVAFNVVGHMYFLEDGGEHGTIFQHNLGIRATPIGKETLRQLLPTDNRPAIFWISNPDNTWVDNAAVGGFHGYWFAMSVRPLGLGREIWANSPWMWPRRIPLRKFDGNSAHSCMHTGLMIDDMQKADGTTEMGDYDPRMGPYNETKAGAQVPAHITKFTAYKCRDSGVWGKGSGGRYSKLILADNSRAFMVNGNSLLEDSIIIGETDNIGNTVSSYKKADRSYPSPWGDVNTLLAGHSSYDNGGPQFSMRNKFINFVSKEKRPAGALVSLAFGPFMNFPRNQLHALTFENANQVYIAYSNVDAQYGWNVLDVDGSTTGIQGGAWIQSNETHMRREGCQLRSSWNAYVCPIFPEGFVQLSVSFPDAPASSGVSIGSPTDSRKIHGTFFPFGGKVDGPKGQSAGRDKSIMSNLIARKGYSIRFTADDKTLGKSPKYLKLNMQSSSPGDWIVVGIPYPRGSTFQIKQQGWPNTVWTLAKSVEDMSPTSYYYDANTQHLYLLLINMASGSAAFQSYYGYGVSSGGYWNPVEVQASCGGCLVSPHVIPPVPKLPKGLAYESFNAMLLPTQSGANYTGTAYFFLVVDNFNGNVELQYRIYHTVPGTGKTLSLTSPSGDIETKPMFYGNSAVQSSWSITRAQWQLLVNGTLSVVLRENKKEILRGLIKCAGKCSSPPSIPNSNPCKPSYGIYPLYQEVNFPAPMQRQNWSNASPNPTANLNFTGDALCGKSSARIGLTGGFFGVNWWSKQNDFVLPSQYKYLEFWVKVVKGYGEYTFSLAAHNSKNSIGNVAVSRQNTDNFVVDEYQWTRVRIPVSQLNIPGQTIKMLGFQTSVWPPKYAEFLIDEWRFAAEGNQAVAMNAF